MQGRYGFDSFSNFLLTIGMILVLINLILSFTPMGTSLTALLISFLAWIVIIYSYFRVFSKNFKKRNAENEWFVKRTSKIRECFRRRRCMRRIRRTHRIFVCPACSQKIKIPKGKGKIVVTCPKCRMEFNEKT